MTKKELTEVQKERIREAINRFCNGTGFNGKSLYDVYPTIESIINQQTATLFTLSEVQKIVENVYQATKESASISHVDYTMHTIEWDSLDLDQFIPKK